MYLILSRWAVCEILALHDILKCLGFVQKTLQDLKENLYTSLGTPVQLLMQISNQPIICQQLDAFRYIDMIKVTCWSSDYASERGRRVTLMTLKVTWWLVTDELVWVFQKLISWNFPTQPSLEFTETGLKKRKYPMRSSSLGQNALLMSGQRKSQTALSW